MCGRYVVSVQSILRDTNMKICNLVYKNSESDYPLTIFGRKRNFQFYHQRTFLFFFFKDFFLQIILTKKLMNSNKIL